MLVLISIEILLQLMTRLILTLVTAVNVSYLTHLAPSNMYILLRIITLLLSCIEGPKFENSHVAVQAPVQLKGEVPDVLSAAVDGPLHHQPEGVVLLAEHLAKNAL